LWTRAGRVRKEGIARENRAQISRPGLADAPCGHRPSPYLPPLLSLSLPQPTPTYPILSQPNLPRTAYKGPFNVLVNVPRVFTPEDTAIQTPNSDTPYSFLGLDLRGGPVAVTVPPVEAGRYWSAQFVDLYTHNAAYLGSRTTGSGGGAWLVAGPAWDGDEAGAAAAAGREGRAWDGVIRLETEVALCGFRTQLLSPEDLPAVVAIQSGYGAKALGGAAAPRPAAEAAADFPAPLLSAEQRTSPAFFDMLDVALRFAPVVPSERDLRARLASVGLAGDPAKPFRAAELDPAAAAALAVG